MVDTGSCKRIHTKYSIPLSAYSPSLTKYSNFWIPDLLENIWLEGYFSLSLFRMICSLILWIELNNGLTNSKPLQKHGRVSRYSCSYMRYSFEDWLSVCRLLCGQVSQLRFLQLNTWLISKKNTIKKNCWKVAGFFFFFFFYLCLATRRRRRRGAREKEKREKRFSHALCIVLQKTSWKKEKRKNVPTTWSPSFFFFLLLFLFSSHLTLSLITHFTTSMGKVCIIVYYARNLGMNL